ncbi:dihydrofolate reductase family protein [Amycolatopsis tolypomycina]|uniref:dihydrofolate reductase family protein n=1 Tax=Amycolatopsis tolypomycina TaxID=208445 RepID=UPI001FCA3BDA|nr:dihydrofolate reductase family protein [Amycolatopsis tolypomycina]
MPRPARCGPTTVNSYLAAGLVDELRLHVAPYTLGGGVRLFDGVPPLNLEQIDARATTSVTHLRHRVLR